VGKQSRHKRERPPGEAKAHRYLARAGLPDRPDPRTYRRLAAADPAWFRLVCEADDAAVALAERGDAAPAQLLDLNQARYRLLYRDLDTALAEYASRPVMIAAAWLRWWFEHHPPATRLLDVGCGPGVLTCAYGLALPDAEVIGVDVLPEAVDCATELAGRVGARNVSFLVGDVLDPAAAGEVAGGGAFDQVVAVTALADAGVYPRHPPGDGELLSSLADVDGPGLAFRSPGADRLVERLSPGGSLLVFDRTPDPSQAVRLGAALLHGGVDLDLRRSGVEVFIEEGQLTTFTRFAGVRPPAAGRPASAGAELAAWIKAAEPPAYGPGWHDELRLGALKAAGARLVWGCEIDYRPHSPAAERREIWDLGDELYGWITTTTGLRTLVTGKRPEDLWQEFGAHGGRCAASGLQVRFYGFTAG
jgi:SAM-dependent methyltransferase